MDKELDFITDLLGEFLGKEDPKNVALVLSRLDSTLPVVLGKLPGAIQAEVVLHLFQLREGPFGMFRWTAQDLGGIEVVARILNRSGSTLEREVLVYLDEHDPELAQQIRSKMFSFEDIARLSNQEIQQLLEEVNPSDLAVALKGVDEQIRDRFLSNMSDTGTSTAAVHSKTRVQEEMATSEPVKILDVENARERIVQEVRRMEQQGKASIVRGDGGIRDTIL